MSAAVPVLVLGTGVSALGTLRVLGRAGIPAYAVDGRDRMLRRSRWYRPLPLDPPADSLENWLPQVPFAQAVLMPCSDGWARRIAEARASFGTRFFASVPAADVLELLLDKGRFAEALQRLQVPHPWSALIQSAGDLQDIPEAVFRNAFLKPRDSQRFFQAFGVKAFRVQSRAEAVERLRNLENTNLSVILQEYIPGSASDHYFVDGFIDAGGVRRSAFARQRQRMYPPEFGNSSYMVSVAPEAAAAAIESVSRLLSEIGYRGMFSAEFKRDPRDGTFRLLEVNARAWWYVEFAARCGVDVCSQAYHDALGQPVATITQYRTGQSLVYPYYDFNACRTLWRRGELSLWQWARSWMGAMQPVFESSDPLPGLDALSGLLLGKLRRKRR